MLPSCFKKFFMRIAGDGADLLIELEKASCLRINNDHADEWHVEKMLLDLARSGVLYLQEIALDFFPLPPEFE